MLDDSKKNDVTDTKHLLCCFLNVRTFWDDYITRVKLNKMSKINEETSQHSEVINSFVDKTIHLFIYP